MDHSFSEGQLIGGRYRLERQLGAGGMGAVFRATHTATGRRVALKVILPNKAVSEGLLTRFQRESMALGRIDSPYVTQVLDAGTDESGAAFLVMELFEGEDVERLSERLGPLPPQLGLRIAFQALLGLQAAHDAGVVHRDIKPANIFLAKRSDGERAVKVLDFGIVKLLEQEIQTGPAGKALTATGSAIGSAPYMSPEQLRSSREVDHRTDIWSLGVTLYQALAARSPFVDVPDIGQIVWKICLGSVPVLSQEAPWISPEISAIVDRALRRDLSERYPSARAMADAIRPLLSGSPSISEELLVPLPEGVRSRVAVPAPEMAPAPPPLAAPPAPLTSPAAPLAPPPIAQPPLTSPAMTGPAASAPIATQAMPPGAVPIAPPAARSLPMAARPAQPPGRGLWIGAGLFAVVAGGATVAALVLHGGAPPVSSSVVTPPPSSSPAAPSPPDSTPAAAPMITATATPSAMPGAPTATATSSARTPPPRASSRPPAPTKTADPFGSSPK